MKPVWIVLLLCFLNGCTGLFFHPSTAPALTPKEAGLEYQSVRFDGEAGELYAWWVPAVGEAKGTVFFAHGNAGNISTHLGFVHWLPRSGYNLFMFDYRGYGASAGEPDAMGIVNDTQVAIRYLREQLLAEQEPFVVYGHSLGGATALVAVADLADKQGIAGLVIDSAFSSYRDEAREQVSRRWWTAWLYPLVPLLITSEPVPEESAPLVSPLSIALTHSPTDQVIPYEQGQALFDAAREPKTFYTLKATGHNHGWQHPEDRAWFISYLEQRFAVDQTQKSAMLAP